MGGNERRNRKMTLSQIRNRVQVLQRKFALELTVIRLRPYATEFCEQWAVAKTNHQPAPQSHAFHQEDRRRWLPPPHLRSPPQIHREALSRRVPRATGHHYRPPPPCRSPDSHRRRLPLGPIPRCGPQGPPPARILAPHSPFSPQSLRPLVACIMENIPQRHPRLLDIPTGSCSHV